jgi:glycosyltransferase involved in cell wall biosynthesis
MIVLNFPSQPHFFSFGGFDIQMNRVIDNIGDEYLESIRVDLWNQKQEFDIAHFWGSSNSHIMAIEFCKKYNKKIVLSPLFPPDSYFNNMKLWFKIKLLKFFGIKSALYMADFLFVINQSQAEFAQRLLGISKNRIFITPTMLDDIFYDNIQYENSNLIEEFDDYCLCIGTICSRKNQLNLLKSALNIGKRVLLIGKVENSEKQYIEEVFYYVKSYSNLFKHIENVSPEDLKYLIKNCSIISCLSFSETEPASVLEGMIFNKPILVSNKPFSQNVTFNGVYKVDPLNLKEISRELDRLSKIDYVEFCNFDSRNYKPINVFKTYNKLYKYILNLS